MNDSGEPGNSLICVETDSQIDRVCRSARQKFWFVRKRGRRRARLEL